MNVGTRRRHIKAATSLNDIAVTALTEEEKQQARTEEKEEYEALDRLIDSITRDFSRKGINSRLKALAKKSTRNAATICNHILAEQTEHNIKTSTAENKVKSLLWLSKFSKRQAIARNDKTGHSKLPQQPSQAGIYKSSAKVDRLIQQPSTLLCQVL